MLFYVSWVGTVLIEWNTLGGWFWAFKSLENFYILLVTVFGFPLFHWTLRWIVTGKKPNGVYPGTKFETFE